jgi:hypothetical protein
MFGRLLAGHMYAFELRVTVRRRAFTYTVPSFSVVTFAGTLEKSATCHYGLILSRPTKTKAKWSFVAKAQEVSRGFVAWSHTG